MSTKLKPMMVLLQNDYPVACSQFRAHFEDMIPKLKAMDTDGRYCWTIQDAYLIETIDDERNVVEHVGREIERMR